MDKRKKHAFESNYSNPEECELNIDDELYNPRADILIIDKFNQN